MLIAAADSDHQGTNISNFPGENRFEVNKKSIFSNVNHFLRKF